MSPQCASALHGLELRLILPTTMALMSLTRLQTNCIAEEVGIRGQAGLVQLPEGCPAIVYNALLKETCASVIFRLQNQQPLAENA
jgi:hypothetical protein